MVKFIKWFRNLSLFNWHNQRIKQLQLQVKHSQILYEYEKECRLVLVNRMNEWISRSEGSRYRNLYEELKNKPNHLEAHCNKQAKIINWIRAEMATMYPKLVDKAMEKTK